jgi:hypothetical protein
VERQRTSEVVLEQHVVLYTVFDIVLWSRICC